MIINTAIDQNGATIPVTIECDSTDIEVKIDGNVSVITEKYDDTKIKEQIVDLGTAISDEEQMRIRADAILQEQIDNIPSPGDIDEAIAIHNGSNSAHENIRQLITDEASDRASADTTLQENIDTVSSDLLSEVTNRTNADNDLQEQIDAIVSSTDVKDVVGTYTELENYDTSTLGDKDIIKVLEDSTHDGARTYYRWDLPNEEWDYIGSEGAYYTKAESDSKYVPQTRTINGKALSNNISLDYSDTGSQPTLVSGTNIKTINNESLLGEGNIEIETGGATRIIKIGQTTYQEAYDIITSQGAGGNYGVILTIASSTYTAMRPTIASDRITFSHIHNVIDKSIVLRQDWVTTDDEWGTRTWYAPTNNNLKTINNISIIGTENIEVQEKLVSGTNIKTINNQTILGAGNVELQETLVSGTNIKTINNESLLGSGNIDIDNTFVAVYNETSFDDINQAYNDKKQLFVNYNGQIRYVNVLKNSNMQYWLYFLTGNTHLQRTRYMVTKSGSSTIWNIDVSYYANVDNVYTKTEIDTYLNAKQDTLVSGTNIKTINNQSLLGSGNIDIQGGGTVDTQMSDSSENAVQNKVIKSYVDDNASKIDKIKVNGTEQTITNKEVDLEIPTVVTLAGRDETDSIVDILNNTANNQSGVILSVVDDTVGFSLHNRAGIETQSKVLATTDYVDANGGKIDKIKIGNAELPITNKTVTIPNQVSTITRTQYQMNAYNVNGIHDNTLTISKVSGANRLNISAWDVSLQESVFNYDVPNGSEIGDLSLLTTDDKTSLVNALNEVYEKSGEPFRVKNWTGSWADGVTIPVCTKEISNTQIAKMVFSISAEEGADYQIVGMIAYEVFDAVTGGNRLNVFPVCQFTGNGQKELSVRWTCMGTSDKLAKRINAWVLLKHR